MLALVKGLPEDAAVWRPDKPGWTHQHELAALNIEIVDFWGRFNARLLGAKKEWLPPPPQITHPDRAGHPGRQVTTDPAEIRRFFAQHMRKG